jgi:polar amino acid transport system substrate-binding protein
MRLGMMLVALAASFQIGSATAGSITIGAEDDWYPYSGVINGVAQGYGVEIARAAFAAVKVEALFIPLPYKRCIEMTRRGQLVSCLQPTRHPDNEDHFHWTKEPLLKARSLIYAKEGSGAKNLTVRDLEGKTVAVTINYEYGLPFDKNTEIIRERAVTELSAFRMLDAGRAQFAVGYEKVVNDMLKHNASLFTSPIVPVGEISVTDQYAVFSRRHPNGKRYMALFEKGLALIRKNGTYAEIEKRYP